MPELCISIALVAIGGMLWDAARRYMQLAHGRMLSADRSQTFERAITQLEMRLRALDSQQTSGIDQVISACGEKVRALEAKLDQHGNIAAGQQARLGAAEAELADIKRSFGVAYGAQDAVVNRLRESVTDWQAKAEATFEKQQAEIARYDGALVNLTEEVVKLQQQQVMALQGVVNLPKHGYKRTT